MRPNRAICDGRSLEKRSASRQIRTSTFATVSPGRASLLRATTRTAILRLEIVMCFLQTTRRYALSLVLGFLALGALTGCVTNPTQQAKIPTAESGVVVLSLGSRGKYGASSHSLKIREVGKSEEILASYLEENLFAPTPRDFDRDGVNGAVLIFHLRPGMYEIFNFSTFFNGYPSTATFGSKQDFSVRFTVSKSETTYLGRYLANRATGKNLLGMTVTAGVFFDVSDQAQDDLTVASTRFERIRSQATANFVGAAKSANTPLIRVN